MISVALCNETAPNHLYGFTHACALFLFLQWAAGLVGTNTQTQEPSSAPSYAHSRLPSTTPSMSIQPHTSAEPSSGPTSAPSTAPSSAPSPLPSTKPSMSFQPSTSVQPSSGPSSSGVPSPQPSSNPSSAPSDGASSLAPSESTRPSYHPSMRPSTSAPVASPTPDAVYISLSELKTEIVEAFRSLTKPDFDALSDGVAAIPDATKFDVVRKPDLICAGNSQAISIEVDDSVANAVTLKFCSLLEFELDGSFEGVSFRMPSFNSLQYHAAAEMFSSSLLRADSSISSKTTRASRLRGVSICLEL